jgi:hypothetical protein
LAGHGARQGVLYQRERERRRIGNAGQRLRGSRLRLPHNTTSPMTISSDDHISDGRIKRAGVVPPGERPLNRL